MQREEDGREDDRRHRCGERQTLSREQRPRLCEKDDRHRRVPAGKGVELVPFRLAQERAQCRAHLRAAQLRLGERVGNARPRRGRGEIGGIGSEQCDAESEDETIELLAAPPRPKDDRARHREHVQSDELDAHSDQPND